MTEQRFHIAEWYGWPFHELSNEKRKQLAEHTVGGSSMKKKEIDRLVQLEAEDRIRNLNKREVNRLSALRNKLEEQKKGEMPCPFKTSMHQTCSKPGGVCSIRIFEENNGSITPIAGDKGRIRSLCPWRFHQDNIVFDRVGERLLGDANPTKAGEIGFLESTGNLDVKPGEDVGRIDMILVKSNSPNANEMQWAAVEIQAVYFSGKKMQLEFDQIVSANGALTMPVIKRRPDYRSSGVKRLLPQLQTKVPTLSRWGKKTAVVVDWSFFHSMGAMAEEEDISNADIVWFLSDFSKDPSSGRYTIEIIDEKYTTLENATKGLTGGNPLSQSAFEKRIADKIQS
ncbi:NotI family restriction endonuclease [uncultured Roseibium sp.]|uniref:NotI family restriction endonuclease n=1 Tax=uncultured Roseibium sp. TaxID=1936171 RepID=UPI002594CDED|nr:NotI family restriction endonuclease [uncultured Roseibium sp.]